MPFHIVGVFRSAPFGGRQLAARPDAAAIGTEGMQKMPRRCPANVSEPARVGCARWVEPLGQFDPKAPLNSPLARGIGAGLFTRPWA